MCFKPSLRTSLFLFLLMSILPLSACTNSDTKMEFSFNTSTPSDSGDEKTIYLNNDMNKSNIQCL